jgi:hypothetical protein
VFVIIVAVLLVLFGVVMLLLGIRVVVFLIGLIWLLMYLCSHRMVCCRLRLHLHLRHRVII